MKRPTHHYFRLLDRIHRHLLPRTYLEIGVSESKSLALALPCTRAVGVDPDPRPRFAVDPTARVVAKTSDDFFATEDRTALFGGPPVDLTFLDGMHHLEFVLRDFINAERWSAPGSVILVHDVCPPDERTAARDQTARHWAGDVWKLLVALEQHRPELEVHTVPVAPTGLAIITSLDPASTALAERYDQVVEDLAPLIWPPDHTDSTIAAATRSGEDDWPSVRALLPPPYQTGSVTSLRWRRARRTPPRLRLVPAEVERRIGLTAASPALRRIKRRVERTST